MENQYTWLVRLSWVHFLNIYSRYYRTKVPNPINYMGGCQFDIQTGAQRCWQFGYCRCLKVWIGHQVTMCMYMLRVQYVCICILYMYTVPVSTPFRIASCLPRWSLCCSCLNFKRSARGFHLPRWVPLWWFQTVPFSRWHGDHVTPWACPCSNLMW